VRLRRRPSINTAELNENWQPKLYARLIALVLLVAYAIAFVLENRTGVHLHFVFVGKDENVYAQDNNVCDSIISNLFLVVAPKG